MHANVMKDILITMEHAHNVNNNVSLVILLIIAQNVLKIEILIIIVIAMMDFS